MGPDVRRGDDLWAVSCHFNPCRYRQRLLNHRRFRERLPVPLLTVELSHDGDFELEAADADRVVRLQAPDVLWQKERLLNVAIAALPERCEKVAWLDGDVLFERDEWHCEARRLLDRHAMLQLFSHFTDLPRGVVGTSLAADQALSTGDSFAYLHAIGGHEGELFDALWGSRESNTHEGVRVRRTRSSGLAWAARREVVRRHGLYDACIVGCGDRAIACAAYGRAETSSQSWIRNERQRRHYVRWAHGFSPSVAGRVSYVEGRIFHLWHGEFRDRRYRERYRDLARLDFDPENDLAIDAVGCWRWNSDKPEMHEYVRRYFSLRNEDGSGSAEGSAPSSADRAAKLAEGHPR